MTDYPEKPKRDKQKQKPKPQSQNVRTLVNLSIFAVIIIFAGVFFFDNSDSPEVEVTVVEVETLPPTATIAPRNALERGMVAVASGKFAEATEHFTDALEENAAPLDIFMLRAYAYYRMGDYDAALADYNRVIEADPNHDVQAWIGKSEILYRLYEQSERDTVLKEAFLTATQTVQHINKTNAEVRTSDHLLLGNIFYEVEEYGLARTQYEAYITKTENPSLDVIERLGFLQTLE